MIASLGRIVFDPEEINTYACAVEYYFQRYGDLELHRRMIGDRPRTDAFAKALEEVVGRGDVVLDVGTGTGILAMLAAKAGARRVYAIDQAEIAQTAANLAKANGLGKKVKVFKGAAAELELPEKVDLIVSEWLGNLALVEGMLDDLAVARDRNLKKGGKMMPSRVEILLGALDDTVLFCREGPGFWRDPVHGLDLSSLEALELGQGRAQQLRLDPAALIGAPERLLDLDMRTVAPEDPWVEGSIEIVAKRDAILNGFGGWFVAHLAPNVVLDTGPQHLETHWAQTYLPFPPKLVRKGTKIGIDFKLSRDDEERRHVRLALKVGRMTQHYLLE